ncbi:hypothetical protein D9758_003812 [Tetrapyrgos nigripes]|uniref:EthD domain-containing protein n=1 Tax=Tetrapyrgos nigripes TaxID=182062 RepID=A0A8H5LRP1_9AGAR|nr:hypothetical protein D9758_003812 [Tetrapyrgos nigripes]
MVGLESQSHSVYDADKIPKQEWYDGEHVPMRLTIPSFFNAARYKASDSKSPTWLTLYDISEPSVADGPEYQAVHAKGSDRDKSMLAKLQFLTRRAYTVIPESSMTSTKFSTTTTPGRYLLVSSIETTAEGEDGFNKWYEQEHIPLLSKVSGWLRTRRFKLFSSKERGQLKDGAECKPFTYLAIHEFSEGGFMDTPEMKKAANTPWREEVMKQVVGGEFRLFEQHNFRHQWFR